MNNFFKIFYIFVNFIIVNFASNPEWDPSGYIIYCPCMGRFGNQADHFLGSLGFAKSLNRTLILPPWRTYKNVPFDDFFQVKPLREYHKVILAEDFMASLAPEYWPPGERSGWCVHLPGRPKECTMKEGNPFGPFWDGLNVDFDSYVYFDIFFSSQNIPQWQERFPPEKFPVYAFKGAPAHFPVEPRYVQLHKYLRWSDKIMDEAQTYIDKNFKDKKFIGIHLRNAMDWENVCSSAVGELTYMSSPQCLGYHNNKKNITQNMCLPDESEVLRLLKNVVLKTKTKVLFVATDRYPMIKQIEDYLKPQKVSAFHMDPWLPQVDLAILGKSDYFIGNCLSSFSAFVIRERMVNKKQSYFWGID
ncbi:GDP-fucose protein O-fucosyltransferase 1-like [Lineus longissimus]|uniref:GDP-fucose protein O-fucosyltransferase 1-like n=1 Tax=Lineus longissimus TaxID=88925 RepID=UPI002B4EFA73